MKAIESSTNNEILKQILQEINARLDAIEAQLTNLSVLLETSFAPIVSSLNII